MKGRVRPLEVAVELELPETELGAEGDSVEELELELEFEGVLVLVELGVPADVLVLELPDDMCLGFPLECPVEV